MLAVVKVVVLRGRKRSTRRRKRRKRYAMEMVMVVALRKGREANRKMRRIMKIKTRGEIKRGGDDGGVEGKGGRSRGGLP